MKGTKEYKVIQEFCVEALSKTVTEMLNDKECPWTLISGVSCIYAEPYLHFYCALTRDRFLDGKELI